MATGAGFFSSWRATTVDKHDSTAKAKSATKSGGEWAGWTIHRVPEDSSTVNEAPETEQYALKFDAYRDRRGRGKQCRR
jgi:hypothetical protein